MPLGLKMLCASETSVSVLAKLPEASAKRFARCVLTLAWHDCCQCPLRGAMIMTLCFMEDPRRDPRSIGSEPCGQLWNERNATGHHPPGDAPRADLLGYQSRCYCTLSFTLPMPVIRGQNPYYLLGLDRTHEGDPTLSWLAKRPAFARSFSHRRSGWQNLLSVVCFFRPISSKAHKKSVFKPSGNTWRLGKRDQTKIQCCFSGRR